MTPMHVAAEEGHHKIIGLLVRNGADINIKDGRGVSTFIYVQGYTIVSQKRAQYQISAHAPPLLLQLSAKL